MNFAAFDLETAKPIPENVTNLKQYMPLGISCAALAYADRQDVVIWQGVPRLERAACREIVGELREAINNGYTLLTWNGCSFDFSVLAQESGLTEACSHLALEHVDLMLLVAFTKGHFLGLDKALTGAGLSGKVKTVTLSDGTALADMSGVMVPRLWARGEYQAVLNYLQADVTRLLELVRVIDTRKQIEWTSGSGRLQSVPVNRFLPVKDCFGIPEPDVSWMDKPPSREQFVEWIPDWRQRVFGSPAPTRSALPVTDAGQYSQTTREETTMMSNPNIESRTAPPDTEQTAPTIALPLTRAELRLCKLCLMHAWEGVGDFHILAAEVKFGRAAGTPDDDSPYDAWVHLTRDECSALDGALHMMMADAELAAKYWQNLTSFEEFVFTTEVEGVKLRDLNTEIPTMRDILRRLNQAEEMSLHDVRLKEMAAQAHHLGKEVLALQDRLLGTEQQVYALRSQVEGPTKTAVVAAAVVTLIYGPEVGWDLTRLVPGIAYSLAMGWLIAWVWQSGLRYARGKLQSYRDR